MTRILPGQEHKCGDRVWVLLAAILAAAATACAVPELQRESTYPAGWPDIASAPGCSGVAGTYLNKGVLIDKAGQEQDVWLTGLLPFSHRTPPVAERQERAGLRQCARVQLRVEERPWPNSPSRKTSKLVVASSRQAQTEPSAQWEPCAGFELPQGRGWPFEDDVAAGCATNYYTLSMNPGQIVYEAYMLNLANAVDGSLVVKWWYGSQLGMEHVWVRFTRVP
jgi:hypothetical protein